MVRELEEFNDFFILVIVYFTEPINRFCLQMPYLKNDITKTCPCNIHRFFSAVKNENFIGKNLIVFYIVAQNIHCGYTSEPPRL